MVQKKAKQVNNFSRESSDNQDNNNELNDIEALKALQEYADNLPSETPSETPTPTGNKPLEVDYVPADPPTDPPAEEKKPRIPPIDKALLAMEPIADAIGYNELSNAIYIRHSLPWTNDAPRKWRNSDDSFLLQYIQRRTTTTGRAATLDALVIAAQLRSYNPLCELIESITWDGTPRAGHLLTWYLGAEDNEYTREVEQTLLNAIILRSYRPPVKYDYMPVLIGSQGCGKSTFCRQLALHSDYYTDNLGNISTKEAPENIQGKCIVEVAELASLRKRESEDIKSFITHEVDTFRPSYGKSAEDFPRRCVLIGTTNSHTFLSDLTGNRRFLPIHCMAQTPTKDLFSESAQNDFKQAFAETLAHYLSGENMPLVLSATANETAQDLQEGVRQESPYEEPIAELLERKLQEENKRVTMRDLTNVCNVDNQKYIQTEIREVMASQHSDWIYHTKKAKINGISTRYWSHY